MKIIIKPIGIAANYIIEELNNRLSFTFGSPIEISPEPAILDLSYNPERDQYHASTLLKLIEACSTVRDEKKIAIVDVDLYAQELNYVFGMADAISGVAVISLFRLRQEYYGLPPDNDLFLDRATKEAIHELGHTFGLEHCSNIKCVMHFSNSLADTDWKQSVFCSHCQPRLIK